MAAIFVFGSNLAGRHGAGAAREALRSWGAVYGKGIGLQGNSYALPTMGHEINPLSLAEIAEHVRDFVTFARDNPGMSFLVTAIGCGLGGKSPCDIAPMFAGATENVFLSEKLVAALR